MNPEAQVELEALRAEYPEEDERREYIEQMVRDTADSPAFQEFFIAWALHHPQYLVKGYEPLYLCASGCRDTGWVEGHAGVRPCRGCNETTFQRWQTQTFGQPLPRD